MPGVPSRDQSPARSRFDTAVDGDVLVGVAGKARAVIALNASGLTKCANPTPASARHRRQAIA